MLTPIASHRANPRKQPPKLTPPPSPPPLKDRFESTTQEPSTMEAARGLFGQQDSTKVKLGKALGYTLALGLGLAGAMSMIGPADAGQTSVVQQTAVSKALKSSKARGLLQKLPAQFGNQARGLSDAQVRVLKGGMSGHTEFGPIKVNNRKAFVRGHVVGKSVWPEVTSQIRDARSKHSMISSAEERELHQIINQVSRMSKSQRGTIADLMDMVRL
jgi:hypothetical protein